MAKLRRLPAASLTLLAVCGDLAPAGQIVVDLSGNVPDEVTIQMPVERSSFARTHYFVLLGPDGQPASVEGTVIASSYDGATLLSRAEGQWRGLAFVFGHDERNGFSSPTIAVGATVNACRVELEVPGYQRETLTVEPGAKSPTQVRLRR